MSKYLFVFFLLMFFAITAHAEMWTKLPTVILDTVAPEPSAEEIFKIVEMMPSFVGCEDIEDSEKRKLCSDKNIISFINKKIIYPKEARKQGVEGTAVIRFTIEVDGKITTDEKSILRDPGAGIGKEALRIVNIMPDWIAGKHKGKAVRVQFTLPIKFVLEEEEIIPEFQPVTVKWNGKELEGRRKTADKSFYTKSTCSLEDVKEILSEKKKGLPLMFEYGKKNGGFTQYYIGVEKQQRKELIESISFNKAIKKKLLKEIKSGSVIYFYNWEFKKGFLEIEVK